MSTVSMSDQPFVVEVDETTEAVSVASPGPQGATGPTGPQGPTGATGPQGPSGVIAVTSPITNSGTSTSADIGIQDGTTAQKGAVQLEDSTSSTSTTKAATPNSVKSAYDLAGTKVSSVTGTSPIASSGGTTPAISIQDGTTAQKGAVQLEDSTSSTSTTKAATPNSVKSAYDLANGKPSLSSSNPVALGTASAGSGTAASKDDHVHPTTGLAVLAAANTFTVSPQQVTVNTAANVGLIIKGAASQSGNLIEFQESGGQIRTYVDSIGRVRVRSSNSSGSSLVVSGTSASQVPFISQGVASQSGNLTEWQDSAGTVLARVNSGGVIRGDIIECFNANGQVFTSNSGGVLQLTKATGTPANPGAGKARIYFRDGTNANTLKLVVIAGATGTETTVLDNIST